MKFLNCSSMEFLTKIQNRDIILLGASKLINTWKKRNETLFTELEKNILFVVDNDKKKQGEKFFIIDEEKTIHDFTKISGVCNPILLIGVGDRYVLEIVHQLRSMTLHDNTECYNLSTILRTGADIDKLSGISFESLNTQPTANNKLIHCCWLSGEEKPKKYRECIDSWKRFCPDYEIKEWTAENYDLTKNQYLQETYEKKAWAFASDYIRLDVVHEYGGIYLDMDVELLKSLDTLLNFPAFFAFDWGSYIDLGSAFGAMPKDPFIKSLLDAYEKIKFIKEDGTLDKLPQPTRFREFFERYGFNMNGATQQMDGRVVLSGKYFSVFEGADYSLYPEVGKGFGIHWHNAGWFDGEEKVQLSKYRKSIMDIDEIFRKNS